MSDLTAWLDEREREASAATPGPWERNGSYVDAPPRGQVAACHRESFSPEHIMDNAAHIAAWSPDTVLRVLRALRAAKDLRLIYRPKGTLGPDVGECYTMRVERFDELQAALNALPGAKP